MAAFNPPSRRDIVERIVLRIQGQNTALTDVTPIAVIRQLIEAVVDEFVPLWAALVQLRRDSLIGTARGDALDRDIADFDLTRPGEKAATGKVLVAVTSPSTIAAGAQLRTESDPVRRYQVAVNPVTSDGSWPIEDSGYVDVVSIENGSAGNTASDTITQFDQGAPSHLDSVTNEAPLDNGTDAATDSETVDFFIDYLNSLKGSTRGALIADIGRFVDPVTGKRVHSVGIEEWDGVTPIEAGDRRVALRVWIDQGLGLGAAGGATADPDLVASVQRFVDGSDTEADPGTRDAGTPAIVEAALGLGVAVNVRLDVDASYSAPTVAESVRSAVLSHFGSIAVASRDILGELRGQFSLAKLNRSILNVPGVLDATFVSPRGDMNVPTGYKAVATSIEVSTRTVAP